MELFYCDESGTSISRQKLQEVVCSNKDGSEKNPWYFLGALAIPEKGRQGTYQLASLLRKQYITKLAPSGLLHEKSIESELKGSRLFQIIDDRLKNFRYPLLKQLSKDEAAKLVENLIEGLLDMGLEGAFYLAAIEQKLLYRKYFRIARPAAFAALTYLQQRACSRLQHKNELGAFIIDRGSAIEKQWDLIEFLSTRDQITMSTRTPPIEYDRFLLENPLGVVSSDCVQIQLCDVLTYIVGRAVRENNPSWQWFQKVLPLIASRTDGTRLRIGLIIEPPEAIPSNFLGI